MAIRSTAAEDMYTVYGCDYSHSCRGCNHLVCGQCALHERVQNGWNGKSAACGMWNRNIGDVTTIVKRGGILETIPVIDRGEEIENGEFIPVRNKSYANDYTAFCAVKMGIGEMV